MKIKELINKKRKNIELNSKEIKYIVTEFTNDNISKDDMTTFLKEICKNDLSYKEILYLTKAYVESGEIIKYDDEIKVCDKHSTGGIGDKVSIVLIPLLHSTNLKIGKLSGKGLGFTGGTVDKFESIRDFNIYLDIETFKKNVVEHGMAISGQTDKLCPADKKIYDLRNETNTINSLGLITASIISKKIASGSTNIVLDIKYGSGAFFVDEKEAEKFGKLAQRIGNEFNRKIMYVLLEMNKPLGNAIGNGIEIKEAVDCLNGTGPHDVIENVIEIASLLKNSIDKTPIAKCNKLFMEKLNNGEAYKSFEKLIEIQGGDLESFRNQEYFKPQYQKSFRKNELAYDFDNASEYGRLGLELKMGRKFKVDALDYHAGIKVVGDKITIYSSEELKF